VPNQWHRVERRIFLSHTLTTTALSSLNGRGTVMNVISIARQTRPLVDPTVSMEGAEARVKSFDQALTFSMHRKHGVPRRWPERSPGQQKAQDDWSYRAPPITVCRDGLLTERHYPRLCCTDMALVLGIAGSSHIACFSTALAASARSRPETSPPKFL